ncbi:MAG TPA: NADH-quinone oxidoreductase subunit H [Solirubrobacterales bacterium]|nr:NADH-quinone oxidoreductase subunit H [Solirubrobacterales bacterium]
MTFVAALIQVLGGLALGPLLVGMVQSSKARLQGRRGPSPLQPYRDLRRLWGKSGADPQPTTIVYRLAPCLVAACTALALLLLPIAGRAPDWSLGNDALVLVGLLALGRFALAAAGWDTGSGFSLMSSGRDLTFAVFAEALMALALLLAALPAASTDLVAMAAAAGGSSPWAEPAHWCAAAAFALVVLVETGRQPIDNPDTHLELTMIHEGPLLEYAGRDLALIQWSAAARHWLVLVLAAELFAPHWGGFWEQLGWLALTLPALCAALALTETAQAKMRILRVPGLLAGGCALALIGLASALVGGLV